MISRRSFAYSSMIFTASSRRECPDSGTSLSRSGRSVSFMPNDSTAATSGVEPDQGSYATILKGPEEFT